MHFEHSVEVESPPAILWPLLTQPEQMKRWDPALIDLVPKSESGEERGELKPGTEFVLKVNEFGKESHFLGNVLDYRDGETMDFRMQGGRFGDAFHITYDVEDLGGGRSRLGYKMDKTLHGKMRYIAPLIWLLNKIVLPIFLGKVKKLAESDARAG